MLGWEPRRWKRDFIKRSRISVSERTTFRGRGELETFATRGPRRWVLRLIITSPGGTICLITFDSSSISWRVSNEPVSARVSGSPWTIKHWSLGTLGFWGCGSEGDFSAELLLRRFPCASRHGPSDAVIYRTYIDINWLVYCSRKHHVVQSKQAYTTYFRIHVPVQILGVVQGNITTIAYLKWMHSHAQPNGKQWAMSYYPQSYYFSL